MDTVLDIFNQRAFHATTLTDSINIVPNMYGRMQELGLFRPEPIPTTSVAVGIVKGVLNVLPSRPRGSAGTLGTPEARSVQSFTVPHFPHEDAVLASDVQNWVSWAGGINTGAALESVMGFTNRKLATMRTKHSITLENLRMGAINGVITDADGTTLLNLFTAFGITQKSVDFTFGTANRNLNSVCRSVTGYMEDNLLGETMSSVYCLASPVFMDNILKDAGALQAFTFFNAPNGQNPNRDDMRKRFPFGGIMFEEYRGFAQRLNEDNTRTSTPFITSGEARFFPLGTFDTFVNYWAPPDFLTEVNQAPNPASQVFVAPLKMLDYGKGVGIHTESNTLPLVKRPALLVRGFSSN